MNTRTLWLTAAFLVVLGITTLPCPAQTLPQNWVLSDTPVFMDIHGVSVSKEGPVYKAWLNDGASSTNGILYSASSDGLTWSSSSHVYSPAQDSYVEVVERDGTYYLWTVRAGSIVDCATSPDGEAWTDAGSESGYDFIAALPTSGGFEAWFGVPARNEYLRATSTDGVNWSTPQSVLSAGAPGEYDHVLYDFDVIKHDGTYHMWYSAHPGNGDPALLAYATSADGLSWAKHGVIPGFDGFSDNLCHHSVLHDGTKLQVWFHEANSQKIFYAETPEPATLSLLALGGVAILRRRRRR